MPSSDDLQFDTAEPTAPVVPTGAGMACAACRRPIRTNYFSLGNQALCPDCVAAVNGHPDGSGFSRLVMATTLGLAATIGGAIVWYGVRRLLHVNIGLIAVAVGYFVGKSVRKGSGNRGGVGYQVLAVAITCIGIALSYFPDDLTDILNDQAFASVPLSMRVIVAGGLSFAAPFLRGSPIGLLIDGFALWEAWKFSAAVRLPVTGPYAVAGFPVQPVSAPPLNRDVI